MNCGHYAESSHRYRRFEGIGAGIAKAFSAEGAIVVVNYSSSKEGADRVLAEIADAGGNAIAIQASVSNPEEVKRLSRRPRQHLDGLTSS